jgi:serine/threonine-protein kinase
MVEVPNVLTYTQQQATDQLTAKNLKVITKQTNGNADTKGTVTGQDPVAGTQLAEGSSVTITVNQGPKTATIPKDLVGKNVSDAEDELAAAGFTNITKKEASTESPGDKANAVLSVSPSGGSTAALDASITLTFATGKSPVPNLTERLYDAAQTEAEQAGFKTKKVEKETSAVAPGLVISQSPQAGTTASRGSTITLTVAVAPPSPPPSQSTAPSAPTSNATPSGGNS